MLSKVFRAWIYRLTPTNYPRSVSFNGVGFIILVRRQKNIKAMFPQQSQQQSQPPFGRGLPLNGMGMDSYINAPRPANYQSLGKAHKIIFLYKNLLEYYQEMDYQDSCIMYLYLFILLSSKDRTT